MIKTVNFKPVNDYILVALPEVSEKTKSGIIKSEEQIEEERNKTDDYLDVVAVSDEVKNIKLGYRVLVSVSRMNAIRIDKSDILYGLVPLDGVLGYELGKSKV